MELLEFTRVSQDAGEEASLPRRRRRGRLDACVRERIIQALREGRSQYATAKQCGVTRSFVNRIAREEGIPATGARRSATKGATEARRSYTRERRLLVCDRLFALVEAMMAECSTASELRQLVTAFAILVDKRRLEDGSDRHLVRNEIDMTGYSREDLKGIILGERTE